ncbi:hypothetical protein EW145_g5040 [Phellinidium pouzarii]|uniref:Uncharacterized protein n=1 Tax=Phellinidium pouzarii TaxID=167371 RepID=A0A4S4L3B0_9AGAM|nr:hypothetical protein EW145_g5040 [Phellinidium pouzarii]
MLKRQRPSTPPASMAEIPAHADIAYGEASGIRRNTKRRRVLAPALDGRQRGMRVDDEGWPDEEIDPTIFVTKDSAQQKSGWEEQAGQYKHANILLHQLHLEHQWRAQSSNFASSSAFPYGNYSITSSTHYANKDAHVVTSTQFHSDSRLTAPGTSTTQPGPAEESSQVRARYEDNNRLLGSIVRQRMQAQSYTPEPLNLMHSGLTHLIAPDSI